MTIINREVQFADRELGPGSAGECLSLEIRWSAVVTRWRDPFGLFTNGQRSGTVQLVVSINRSDVTKRTCCIAAWLELGDRRRVILPVTHGDCAAHNDGDLSHLDVTLADGTRIVALSHRDSTLVFARSTLLEQCGFIGGSYDPPQMTVP